MSALEPIFTFEDGIGYALLDNRVIASHKDPATLEKLAEAEVNEEKKKDLPDFLKKDDDDDKKDDDKKDDDKKELPDFLKKDDDKDDDDDDDTPVDDLKKATHITTPNGLKGEILNRTPSLWGDSVNVRMANGTIANFDVTPDTKLSTERTKTASGGSRVQRLASRLAATPDPDRNSLIKRFAELGEIREEAIDEMRGKGVSFEDEQELDRVVTESEQEGIEIDQALEAMDDNNIGPYQSPEYKAAPTQAPLGQQTGWLDNTLNDIAEENSEEDFEKLLGEGPALFADGLEDGALADQGATRELALSHIRSKTAGILGDDVKTFHSAFLARVEEARREELSRRKQDTKKEASTQKESFDHLPDESVFL